MELFEDIRRAHRVEGASIRKLSRDFEVHRRTVRAALGDPVPPPRKMGRVRACPVTGPVRAMVRGWLVADLDAPRKQRHTAHRVWVRLIEEEGVVISERTVRQLVAALRGEIGERVETMVPQTHVWGAEAEVDFGEFYGEVAGVATRLFLFVCRLSASGKVFARVYANMAQEVFLDGHVRAFEFFGGVPGRCRYDNLKDAVVDVLRGRDRREHDRFVGLRSYYGFDSFYCQPGIKGAHEKGGVEGAVGFLRRNVLVPVPKVASLSELNELIDVMLIKQDHHRIGQRSTMIGQDFATEAPCLGALPASGPFEAFSVESRKVDAKARISVRGAWYSVPVGLVGRRVTVKVGAEVVEAFDPGGTSVARHVRAVRRGEEVLDLDHYLEVLEHKPGALTGSTPLVQARAAGVFTQAHQAWWDAARRANGDQAGTKALIEVLTGTRRLDRAVVEDALEVASKAGWSNPQAVIIEARRLGEVGRGGTAPIDVSLSSVVSVTGPLVRAVPSLGPYDELITGVAP
jgi:transposase